MFNLRSLPALFLFLSVPVFAATHAPVKAKSAQSAPRVADADIERAFKASMAESAVSDDGFTIHVHGGVATLDGRTNVMQHKGVATRYAKKAGALAVVNNIQISEAARQKALANLERGRQTRLRRASLK